MCRVGHSFIKEEMKKNNAIFAGEVSGHYYFRENFFTDSGIIASLLMVNIISKDGKLRDLVEPLKKYYDSGEINFEVTDKSGKIKQLEEFYKNGKISHLDGIKIDFDDWWFNVRASNTEPLLRLNLVGTRRVL